MFQNCGKLKEINLNIKIATIESNAFENCINLELKELTQKLVKIGDNTFKKCLLQNIFDFFFLNLFN